MTKIKKKVSAFIIFTILYLRSFLVKLFHPVANENGWIDEAVKILIGVVIGALLLYGIYALISNTVMPDLKQKITDMFSYNGGTGFIQG